MTSKPPPPACSRPRCAKLHRLCEDPGSLQGVGCRQGCRLPDHRRRRPRSAGVRLLRDNVVIHEGTLKTLKRFKDEVKEVHPGRNAAWPSRTTTTSVQAMSSRSSSAKKSSGRWPDKKGACPRWTFSFAEKPVPEKGWTWTLVENQVRLAPGHWFRRFSQLPRVMRSIPYRLPADIFRRASVSPLRRPVLKLT
jgi:hypothetical protein